MEVDKGFCIVEHGPFIIAQLHATKIGVINLAHRRCKLYHGAWKTRATKEAMNLFLSHVQHTLGQNLSVSQSKFRWYVSGSNFTKEFLDGSVHFEF